MEIDFNKMNVNDFLGDIPAFLNILKDIENNTGVVVQQENDSLLLMFGNENLIVICFSVEGKFISLSKNERKILKNRLWCAKDILNLSLKNDVRNLEKEPISNNLNPLDMPVEIYSKKAALLFMENYLELNS